MARRAHSSRALRRARRTATEPGMSYQAMLAVFDGKLPKFYPAGKLLILLAYAERAHPDGSKSFPGLADLTRRGRMSRRQAMRWRTQLVKDEILVLEAEGSYTFPPTYRVNVEK